jgi:hypothetical protein
MGCESRGKSDALGTTCIVAVVQWRIDAALVREEGAMMREERRVLGNTSLLCNAKTILR